MKKKISLIALVLIVFVITVTAQPSAPDPVYYDGGVGYQAVIRPFSASSGIIEFEVVEVTPTATVFPPTSTPIAPTNTPPPLPTNTPTAVPTNTPTPLPTDTPTAVPTPTPPNIPAGNLVTDKCFSEGFTNWFDEFGVGEDWHLSDKPSPACPQGNAARCGYFRATGGVDIPLCRVGAWAILSQVVAANPDKLGLQLVGGSWVHDLGEQRVEIWGGDSETGPWTHLWTPFSMSGDGDRDWHPIPATETQLDTGYPFFKVEIKGAMYVSNVSCCKITGIDLRQTD